MALHTFRLSTASQMRQKHIYNILFNPIINTYCEFKSRNLTVLQGTSLTSALILFEQLKTRMWPKYSRTYTVVLAGLKLFFKVLCLPSFANVKSSTPSLFVTVAVWCSAWTACAPTIRVNAWSYGQDLSSMTFFIPLFARYSRCMHVVTVCIKGILVVCMKWEEKGVWACC